MQLDFQWEYDWAAADEDFINHLLVSIKTPPDPAQKGRNPVAVCLVVDKSWSMKGEKLASVIEACSSFIRWMTRSDHIGVVAYSASAEVVQQMTPAVEKQSIINNLQSIEPGTSTNLSAGWLQAVQMLKQVDESKASVKRILLLTDGLATSGIQDQKQLESVAAQSAKDGIQVTTIGFGSDFNEDSLQGISKAGLGNYYYIDTPEKTSDIFFQEFDSIGNLYSQATDLKLTLPENCDVKELLNNYPYSQENSTIQINIGDLRCDDHVQLVLGLTLNLKEAAELTAELNYFQIAGEFSQHSDQYTLPIKVREEPCNSNKQVHIETLLLTATRSLIQASEVSKADIDSALRILENIIDRLKDSIHLDPSLLEPVLRRLDDAKDTLRKKSDISGKELISSALQLNRDRVESIHDPNIHDEIYYHSFSGDLDLYNAPEIKQIAQRKMNDGHRYLVYDFSKVSFIDSSAIGALIQISSWLAKRNGVLMVMNLSSSLEKIFAITRINSYIPIAESETDARLFIEQHGSQSTQSD